ncbi:MAG: VWA domain-containing protein, partial [Rhodanobacteraceae bacterium]
MTGLAVLSGLFCALGGLAQAPDTNPASGPQPVPLIRAEKRLVLVDAVVTGKGKYVHGLTAKDFRLWEDKKEQKIESFASEADSASPQTGRQHYLVLFFDNSTMSFGEQVYARRAALKFVETNTAADRLIAVADYGGSLGIAQNFTSNTERLKAVINGTKFAYVPANEQANPAA